nr:mitochondrial outer membrane protein iml2 [Quercus suber]
MLPSAFARILAVFSFRGDRDAALKMLWSATNFTNDINGAIAGLTVLTLNSAIVAGSDILPKDPVAERKRKNLIRELRKLYPKSKLWLLEEARSLTFEREIEKAVQLQTSEGESPLKQLEALRVFELSANYMLLHRYEDSATAFLRCIELNSWSHASYYYHAGICYVELYRIHKTKDPQQAAAYAEKADECLHQALATAGKTRIMGQKMPFDSFITRKLMKWELRARNWDCTLVEAVGVSPLVEMIYFWNGFKRLTPPLLLASLDRLAWSDDPAANPHHAEDSVDEHAILAVLQGSIYRFQGDIARAKDVLRNQVLEYNPYQLKQCQYPDLWPLPVAHYELAVCYWEEAGQQHGDMDLLKQCDDELTKVTKWGSFDLDAGVELKVTLAKETLLKYGVGKA